MLQGAEVRRRGEDPGGAQGAALRSQPFRRTANQRVVVAQGELASLGRPEDLATEILLERCKRFAENPPAEPWDGVDKVTKKKF